MSRSVGLALVLSLAGSSVLSAQVDDPRPEIEASLTALRDAPSYRMTMTIHMPEGSEPGYDLPTFVTERSGDRTRSEIRFDMQEMDLYVRSVSEPGRMVTRMDSEFLASMQAQGAGVGSMGQSIFGGIAGFLSGAMNPMSLIGMGIGFLAQKAAQNVAGDAFELGKWQCREMPADDQGEGTVTSVERLPDAMLDGTSMKAYRVGMAQGSETTEMVVVVPGPGEPPRRMEYQNAEGGMTIDYSDYGAPITIDIPPCE